MALPSTGKTFDQFRADDSSGAAIGASAGLLTGSAFGVGAAQASGYNVQQRYDYSYLQCVYAAGDKVPVRGAVRTLRSRQRGRITRHRLRRGGNRPGQLLIALSLRNTACAVHRRREAAAHPARAR